VENNIHALYGTGHRLLLMQAGLYPLSAQHSQPRNIARASHEYSDLHLLHAQCLQ
jgi:hypothetical protein